MFSFVRRVGFVDVGIRPVVFVPFAHCGFFLRVIGRESFVLFANEAADFGARASRVISASQISTNERTRVETMLPLPTAVPGVDTLTTLQLDAFLKKNPKPSIPEIKTALQNNLCRCGTHIRIVRAVKRASEV